MQTLKPGILVSLKTTLQGNVRYDRRDLEHTEQDNTETARWETVKTVEDVEEHTRATETRGKARSLILSACVRSDFGYLCPIDRTEQLERAILEARRVVATFNSEASRTRVNLYTLTGRIADNDEEATRAIASEVMSLLEQMQAGIKGLDVKAVRDAASRAKSLGQMLESEYADKVSAAVEAARSAARKIVKSIEESGGDGSAVLAELNTQALSVARGVFVDLIGDEPLPEVEAIAPVAAQASADLFADVPDFDPAEAMPEAAPDLEQTAEPVTVATDAAPEFDF